MQKVFIGWKTIQEQAQNRNSNHIEHINQYTSSNQKQQSSPKPSCKSNHKRNKKYHNTYSITSFNDGSHFFLMHQNTDFGILLIHYSRIRIECLQDFFNVTSHKPGDAIQLIIFISRQIPLI